MIQSITKVWTVTLVMQLVDEGLVELDAPSGRTCSAFEPPMNASPGRSWCGGGGDGERRAAIDAGAGGRARSVKRRAVRNTHAARTATTPTRRMKPPSFVHRCRSSGRMSNAVVVTSAIPIGSSQVSPSRSFLRVCSVLMRAGLEASQWAWSWLLLRGSRRCRGSRRPRRASGRRGLRRRRRRRMR